ncbi:hypothetical protein EQV94_23760, partial [Salmonella enterica]|nr:hypothetical protein [Salmonella enterica]EBX2371204.1 hypothetical protein [Salmonella enterica subsp. enterica serovar Infantis]EAM5995342.1 hypothetical protein [Salmonella enterica]EAP6314744.1 hypothetical protein [Salmonella enterica]EBK6849962.1 hypothetical protein [Salmonella enterica]
MRLPCTKGECFLPVDRVTTGRSRPGKVSYALACFIFRFLRCPLIEHFQALAPGQRKSQRRRRCHFWGEAVRGRGAQP